MTHHETTPGSEAPGSPRDEWDDVKRSLDELAAAMTKWASAVKDDPENRRQAREIKERFEAMGKDMGKAIDAAAESDFVRDMGSAAGKAGEAVVDAAKTVGREVRPFMATAFRTAAEGMRIVAEKVDDSASRRAATQAAEAPEPPSEPAASSHEHAQPTPYVEGAEPPAPAPSGTSHPAADHGEH